MGTTAPLVDHDPDAQQDQDRQRPRHDLCHQPAHVGGRRRVAQGGVAGRGGAQQHRPALHRRLLGRAILRNADFYKPIVAAVNGHALAGGAEMLLATDLRVMSSQATFGLVEVRRGLIAGGGSLARLARQVAWADAMELALVGSR